MAKYEYKAIVAKMMAGTGGVAAQLNAEAKEGWRVVCFVEKKYIFILERVIG